MPTFYGKKKDDSAWPSPSISNVCMRRVILMQRLFVLCPPAEEERALTLSPAHFVLQVEKT